ncbi:hypothetical protein EJ110_NYTH56886 [Nymphaea thermarum]|nr:hypothetical protein EJ110_NYTH56886 [Nymphaea thermarum]
MVPETSFKMSACYTPRRLCFFVVFKSMMEGAGHEMDPDPVSGSCNNPPIKNHKYIVSSEINPKQEMKLWVLPLIEAELCEGVWVSFELPRYQCL